MVFTLLAILLLLVACAFFAGSETALTAASRPRLHALEQRGNRRAGMVNRLRGRMEEVIGAILLGNILVNILASALATSLLIGLFGESGVVYATVSMTVLILLFGEVLPKTWAINNPDRTALAVAPLMRLVGRKDLIDDPKFASHEARAQRLEQCFEVVERWTAKRTKFEVMAQLKAIDVPCGPVLSTKDILEDRALYDRGFLVEVPHPERGTYVTVGSPIHLSASHVPVERAPLLGEHTDEVLATLGYTHEEIAGMRAAGAV